METFSHKFTEDYLKLLSEDTFKFICYLKDKNLNREKNVVSESLAVMYSNHKNYLEQVSKRAPFDSVKQLGDMHNGGKCTLLVERSSHKIIYKPVGTSLLMILNDILKILNDSGLFDFYILKILENCNEYSTVEFINNCEPKDIDKFSFHYGALVAVITTLRGVDFHYENILSVNSVPVVIDCESLFYVELNNTKKYDVFATSLVPTQHNRYSYLEKHKLSLDEVFKGIETCSTLINNHKNTIKDIATIGNSFKKRLIFKPTRYYFDVLSASIHPTYLIDSKKRENYLERCLCGTHDITKGISAAEKIDLLNFDIPYFTYFEGELFDSRGNTLSQNFCQDTEKIVHENIEKIIRLPGILKKELLQHVY